MKKPVRIKLTANMCDNISYITIVNKRVSYFSPSEIPLSLSNIAANNAAELRFELEDAKSPEAALAAVKKLATYARKVELL